jgi:hypothetical protein
MNIVSQKPSISYFADLAASSTVIQEDQLIIHTFIMKTKKKKLKIELWSIQLDPGSLPCTELLPFLRKCIEVLFKFIFKPSQKTAFKAARQAVLVRE